MNINAFIIGPGCGFPATNKNYFFLDNLSLVASNPAPSAGSITSSGSPCSSSQTLTAPTSASFVFGYQWYKDGVAISGAISNTYTATQNGVYTVRLFYFSTCETSSDYTVTLSSLGLATTTITDVDCTGDCDGSITVAGSGSSGYQYSIDGGSYGTNTTFSSLCEGNYTFSVLDANGCTASIVGSIVGPANPLSINTVSITGTTCHGNNGTAEFSGSGGAAPYSYSLDGGAFSSNNSFSNLPSGNYTITVQDFNNCTITQSFTVPQDVSTLSVNILGTTGTSCGQANGQGVFLGNGGTSPYIYSVDGGSFGLSGVFQNLAGGSHTITIRDLNNCIATETFTIGTSSGISSSLSSSSNPSCQGSNNGSASISASGGTGSYLYSLNGGSYTSNNTFTSLSPGSYSVTVQDGNGCTSSTSFSISQPSAITPSVASTSDVTCTGTSDGAASISASGGAGSYLYSLNGGSYTSNNTFSSLSPGSYSVTVQDGNGCTSNTSFSISEPSTLTPSVVSTSDVTCAGMSDGSANISASGGTGGYTYSLNGGSFLPNGTFSGLSAGSYTVTVQDGNGCTENTSFSISAAPSSVTISLLSQTNPICGGAATGSISFGGGGGAGSYTYAIDGGSFGSNNTFTNLAAGTYTLTVQDNNGCTASTTATLTEPPALIGSIGNQTNASCAGDNDGTATIAATGGTPNYMFSFEGGAFNAGNNFGSMPAGSYTVTVQDANGCTDNVTINITEPPALVPTILNTTNVSCNGGLDGSVSVMGSGGTPGYTYALNDGLFDTPSILSNIEAGTHNIHVMDTNGCTASTTITITEPPALTLTSTATTQVSCSGATDGSATVAGGGGTPPYLFEIDGGSFSSNNSFSGLSAGFHTITIQDDNNCTESLTINIGSNSTINASISNQMPVSCNGANDGSLTIVASGGTGSFTYAIDGGAFSANNVFTGLSGGAHTFDVQDGNGCTTTLNATIIEPTTLALSPNTLNVSCGGNADGSVTILASGGTSPYMYALDGGVFGSDSVFSNLVAGNYTANLQDANGCTSSAAITITEPTPLTASVSSQINPNCNGSADGEITVAASGGSGNYTYAINGGSFSANPTFSGLNAGNYDITIQDDNNCSVIVSATLSAPPSSISLSTGLVIDVDCAGDSDGAVILFASGGTNSFMYALDGGTYSPNNSFIGLSPGSYTATAQDGNGCEATTSFTVAISDQTPPSIICPNNVSAVANPGNCDALVTIPSPASIDNCAIASQTNDFNSTTNASDTYPIGSTSITWTALDGNGNSASCSMQITVTDNESPTIVCPTNISQSTDPNTCSAAVTVPTPNISDNCPNITLSNTFTGTSDASGTYPAGTTSIDWLATDEGGNTASCTMNVSINDIEAPSIVCPADIRVNTDIGQCDASLNVPAPTAADNCTLSSILNDFNNTSDASDLYPSSNTSLVWTATDADGNTSSCAMAIEVIDSEAPSITCPSDISLNTDPNLCKSLNVTVPTPAANDNCSIASLLNDLTGTSDASGAYSVGSSSLLWTVTDGVGETATCSMNVTVIDNEAPNITCPTDLTQINPNGLCNVLSNVSIPVATDACGISSIVNDYTNTTNATAVYPIGLTSIIWTATDVNGNTASCNMNLTVESPISQGSLTCPNDIIQSTDTGSCQTLVNIPNALLSNICGVSSITNDYNNSSDATDLYGIGLTNITWIVNDINGNSASCDMAILVTDNPSTCANADLISGLPFSATDMTTECSGNDYSNADACGSLYMDSEEYVFEYTPTESQSIDLALSNTMPNTALFVFDGCPDISTTHCIHTETSVLGNPFIENLTLQGGTTYYFIVSTLPVQAFTPFDLTVSPANCGRDIFEPNELFGTAKPLPQIGINLNAQICDEDDHDWYHYTVKESNVQVKLSGLPFNCGLEVIHNGNSFVSNELGLANEVIDLSNLTVGDLIQIHVYGADNGSSSQGYNLHVIERASTINITKDNPAQTLSQPAKGPEQLLTDSNIQVLFYPNPTTDKVYLDFEAPASTEALVTFTNVHGQLVQQGQKLVEQGANHWEVNTQKLALGIYFVSFKMDGQEKTFKLIIE